MSPFLTVSFFSHPLNLPFSNICVLKPFYLKKNSAIKFTAFLEIVKLAQKIPLLKFGRILLGKLEMQ